MDGAGDTSFVAWFRDPVRRGRLSLGSLDARKARGQRQRDRSCRAVWFGEWKSMSLMCQFSRC